MTFRNFVIFIISSLLILSCTGKQEKPDSFGIIPEKDLIPLLEEIHLADGLLPNPRIQNWVSSIDSVSTYHYIAEEHGYTKEALDKTLHYYFVSKPKKLIKIYDKILGEFSEKESRLEKELLLIKERELNIWPGEKYFYYPDSADLNAAAFEVRLAGSLFYRLNFTATLFSDDQSVNARVVAFSYDADSLITRVKTNYKTPAYLKDGMPHSYSVYIFVSSNRPFILKGTLYEADYCIEEWKKHAMFENITLSIPLTDI